MGAVGRAKEQRLCRLVGGPHGGDERSGSSRPRSQAEAAQRLKREQAAYRQERREPHSPLGGLKYRRWHAAQARGRRAAAALTGPAAGAVTSDFTFSASPRCPSPRSTAARPVRALERAEAPARGESRRQQLLPEPTATAPVFDPTDTGGLRKRELW